MANECGCVDCTTRRMEPVFKPDAKPVAIDLELRTVDQVATANHSANVTLLMNDKPYLKVYAYLDYQQGADGGVYPVVRFRKVEQCQ